MPHRATWLAWPHNRETWPTQLETVREVWVRMMQALAEGEQVVLLVNDEQTRGGRDSATEGGGRGDGQYLDPQDGYRGRSG